MAVDAGLPKQVYPSQSGRAAKRLVVASGIFNLILCFLQTRGWVHATSAVVSIVELAILAAGLWVIRDQISSRVLILSAVTLGYVMAAKFINPTESFKVLHDLLVMYIFYGLGRTASRAVADATVRIMMTIVLVIGFFELLDTDLFGTVFNVWQYYVEKGVISQDTINYSNTTLFVSGNRGGNGRTFFPGLLGPHRVSSIFLEPVSLGNFAAIVFGWCLSVGQNRPGYRHITMICLAMLCVVLTDSRFASGCCVAMLLLRFTPLCRSGLFVFLLPLLVLTVLTVTGTLHEMPGVSPSILTDDLKGRLLFSGKLLDYWQIAPWFAFGPSPVYTADTGYAYLFNTLGAPLTLLFFAVFAFHGTATREAAIMKAMMAVYFSTSLCIGANSVTIKTAGLLWFLYGALDRRVSAHHSSRRVAFGGLAGHRRPLVAKNALV